MWGLSTDQSFGPGSDKKKIIPNRPFRKTGYGADSQEKPGLGFHLKISYFLFSHKFKEYRLFLSLRIFVLLLLTFIPLSKRYLNTILIDIYFGGNFDPDPGDQT